MKECSEAEAASKIYFIWAKRAGGLLGTFLLSDLPVAEIAVNLCWRVTQARRRYPQPPLGAAVTLKEDSVMPDCFYNGACPA